MRQTIVFVTGTICGAFLTALFLNAQQPEMDPVKLSPQYYTVRVDNSRVRVLEYHLKPGEKEKMHSHPPGVVYYVNDANFRTTLPDSSVSESAVKAGDIRWRENTTHALENVGATEARAFAVELKPCGNSDEK